MAFIAPFCYNPPMDSNDKNLLDRLMTLTEENNRLLKKMWRAARIGRAVRLFYWLIIIGLSIGALYYIQPYVNQLLSVYSGLQESVDSFQGLINPYVKR